MAAESYNEAVTWEPEAPRLRPIRVLIAWVVAGASLYVAGVLLPGVDLEQTGAAWIAAAAIAVLNAILPPSWRRCGCRTWWPSASSSSCSPTRSCCSWWPSCCPTTSTSTGWGTRCSRRW